MRLRSVRSHNRVTIVSFAAPLSPLRASGAAGRVLVEVWRRTLALSWGEETTRVYRVVEQQEEQAEAPDVPIVVAATRARPRPRARPLVQPEVAAAGGAASGSLLVLTTDDRGSTEFKWESS